MLLFGVIPVPHSELVQPVVRENAGGALRERTHAMGPASLHSALGNDMDPVRVKRLLVRIECAFAQVARPRITKSVARGFDDEWWLSEQRGEELHRLDPEQDWHEVREKDTCAYQEYFTFAGEEGWQFYLPAFMSHYLRQMPKVECDAVYWALSDKDAKIGRLTPKQMECVREFLAIANEQDA